MRTAYQCLEAVGLFSILAGFLVPVGTELREGHPVDKAQLVLFGMVAACSGKAGRLEIDLDALKKAKNA